MTKYVVDLTKNNLYRKKRDITIVETPALDEILKAHMVEGFLDTASINDEQILETVNGYDIRMTVYNTYPQRSVMANCAKVKVTKIQSELCSCIRMDKGQTILKTNYGVLNLWKKQPKLNILSREDA